MNASVDADLIAARGATERLVAPFSQAQFDFTPRAGAWSIGEVVDHLLRSEDLYRAEIQRLIELKRAGRRPYLRRTFADIDVGPAFIPRGLLPWLETPFTLLSAIVPDRVRDVMTQFPIVPVRNPDLANPRRGRPVDELKAALADSIGQTHTLIVAHAELDYRELVSEHPLTGASNVPQIFRFLALHERRHHSQVERVQADPRFPRR